ncbi:hypothetical protein Tco_1475605, partial [Tanacetum coccineum]
MAAVNVVPELVDKKGDLYLYKTLLNELANNDINLSQHEINVGFVNSLPEKWLTFSQGLRNANLTQTLNLANIDGRIVYEDNLIERRYSDSKKTLASKPSSSSVNATTFFSNHVIQDFQENSDDEIDERSSEEYLKDFENEYHERALLANSKRFIKRRNSFSNQKANENTECFKCGKKIILLKIVSQKHLNLPTNIPCLANPQCPKVFNLDLKSSQSKNKGLVAETFYYDDEEVSDDDEVTEVKVLIALADDELSVGKNHARNGEWIDIPIKKVNTLLSMNEASDWQNYLKYIIIDLKFVEDQRLNLLSKYNQLTFELNKYRDELIALKQAKLDAVTFQIQNTELTKLNH